MKEASKEMFRKDSIPNQVIAFGRKLTDRIVEFDATDKYTKSYMSLLWKQAFVKSATATATEL